jgi:hypothetical protein
MNILYFPVHEVLEHDDLRLLTALGHRILSTGAFRSPDANGVLRKARPEFFSRELYGALGRHPHAIENGVPKLDRAFVDHFDAIIVNQEPLVLEANREAFAGKPVIWRTVGQARRVSERRAWKAGRNLFVVRCSKRESALPGFIPSTTAIYFGKCEEDFQLWDGRDAFTLTFFNRMARGDAIPSPQQYLDIVDGFEARLFGTGNEGIPMSKGIAPSDHQFELFRRCGAYLYVHSELACYTLNFVEAMMSGTPILAPTARFIAANARDSNWHPMRYEVEELLACGAGLVYDSITEARRLLRAILQGEIDTSAISAAARRRAVEMFSARKVGEDWAAALAHSAAAPTFDASRRATALGLHVAGMRRAAARLVSRALMQGR